MVSDFISTLGNTNYVVPNGFVYFRMQMNIGSIDVDRKQHSKLGYWSWVIGSIIYWPHTHIRSSLKNVDVSSLKSDEYNLTFWAFWPWLMCECAKLCWHAILEILFWDVPIKLSFDMPLRMHIFLETMLVSKYCDGL